jgi:4-diphosphocytidyl-2-C-methyl-D-erythritol kinase
VLNGDRFTAYAKVNLCLFLGPVRTDGRHELVTLLEPVSLVDDLVISPAGFAADEVVCPGVTGPNLVSEALARLRAEGWAAPPLRVEIQKRIPVAAGMGGGSADAAALLRCAARLAPVEAATVNAIAADLGSDVPSQLDPGPSIATGAGEIVTPVGQLEDHALLVLPQPFGLSTAEVYLEADRLGLPRSAEELASVHGDLESSLAGAGAALPGRLVVNDLEPASLSLRPEITSALECAREAGAEHALVCGSGPTVIGLFWGAEAHQRAAAAAATLSGRFALATATRPRARGVGASVANR